MTAQGTTAQGTTAQGTTAQATTSARILEIVARVTRYPQELLNPDADLEDELGIDSVKLQEILAALKEAFPNVVTDSEREPPRTLREISNWFASGPSAEPLLTSHSAPGRKPEATETDSHVSTRGLAGKIVFVSGSGHGLGRTTAIELSRRGASVIVNSFHQRELGEAVSREIVEAGGNGCHIWGSMARADHVDRIFDEIAERFGGLDIFIHNASNGVFAKLCDVTEEHWLKSFRTNVMGFHRGALRAAKLMRARGGGKMLTLSSVYENATLDYFGVQGPVKAALESLTRFLAKEFMPDNIQVNCLSLGALEGEAMRLYPEAERIRAETEARSQGRRWMTETEAARAQLLFLNPEIDSITGAVIRADRGMMLF